MRSSIWLTLIVCCFIAGAGCSAQPASPPVARGSSADQPANPPVARGKNAELPPNFPVARAKNGDAPVEKPLNPNAQGPVFTALAEGFGTSDELARKDALKSACERVAEYLDKEHNEKNYKPEPQFLQNLNVLPPTDEVKVTSGTVPNMPEMKAATVQIRVTSDSVRRMCEQARQQRGTAGVGPPATRGAAAATRETAAALVGSRSGRFCCAAPRWRRLPAIRGRDQGLLHWSIAAVGVGAARNGGRRHLVRELRPSPAALCPNH